MRSVDYLTNPLLFAMACFTFCFPALLIWIGGIPLVEKWGRALKISMSIVIPVLSSLLIKGVHMVNRYTSDR